MAVLRNCAIAHIAQTSRRDAKYTSLYCNQLQSTFCLGQYTELHFQHYSEVTAQPHSAVQLIAYIRLHYLVRLVDKFQFSVSAVPDHGVVVVYTLFTVLYVLNRLTLPPRSYGVTVLPYIAKSLPAFLWPYWSFVCHREHISYGPDCFLETQQARETLYVLKNYDLFPPSHVKLFLACTNQEFLNYPVFSWENCL